MLDLTKKYRTRDGREVILLYERNRIFLGIIKGQEDVERWWNNGSYNIGEESPLDLIEIKEKPMTEQDNPIIKNRATIEAIWAGKEWEWRRDGRLWTKGDLDYLRPLVNSRYETRPKPEPQWVAWDETTVPSGLLEIHRKRTQLAYICKYQTGRWWLYNSDSKKWQNCLLTFDEFFNLYTQADGSPCGRKVEG